ncbi:hypothetical protein BN970_01537 [Mycolicibacterium conceptionense]|uniref:Transmembrane protein n=1 Tax=Mycolicibacterium conceptionense TaxID=451644 RepID=A0A0U1D4K7_9MYCO|nr:hypothetical protein [Mycolicibacterium conceptionense]CQD07976.1 hypothetical protein BN970_01537 [Mycolicibacterium conceptionense]
MSRNKSSSGASGAIFFLFVLIALVPASVWIALGVITVVVLVSWGAYKAVVVLVQRSHEAQERNRKQQAKQVADAKRQREERIRKEKQRRIDTLGTQNAALVESALSAVKQVAAPVPDGWVTSTSVPTSRGSPRTSPRRTRCGA